MTPAELAKRARHNNVAAIAITDHDTLAGAGEKARVCALEGLECIPGVEISCEYNGSEAHILSLFADPESKWTEQLTELTTAREKRMLAMVERLATIGIRLELSEIPTNGGAMGRPHLARALVNKGVVKSVSEAFGRYLFDKGPVHIAKTRLTASEGIALAKRLGGVSILAHPGISGLAGDLDAFRGMELDGVEAHHPKHGGGTVASLLAYCRKNRLLPSGGSDFHSPGESFDIGSQRTPRELLEPIRELADNRKGRILA